MNDRKQHVIHKAHQLFIDKGFQATSIQDILDFSGISKGTFYNYFSSKNELLIAIFKSIYIKLEKERDALLLGQDPSNIEIFIKQIQLQMESNRKNKLITLFEEVNFLNDIELKQAIKKAQLRHLTWIYNRFIEIFGTNKKPFLLDCAIMFMGILHHNMRYSTMAYETKANIEQVVRYSVNRVNKIVYEVAEAKEQLVKPDFIESWMPETKNNNHNFKRNLVQIIFNLKDHVEHQYNQLKYVELLEFIQEELIDAKHPRKYLISIALDNLKSDLNMAVNKDFLKLNDLINQYLQTNPLKS